MISDLCSPSFHIFPCQSFLKNFLKSGTPSKFILPVSKTPQRSTAIPNVHGGIKVRNLHLRCSCFIDLLTYGFQKSVKIWNNTSMMIQLFRSVEESQFYINKTSGSRLV